MPLYRGRLATEEGAYDQACTLLEQSLALYEESGNAVGQATALTSIGVARSFEERYDERTTLLLSGLPL